MPNNELLTQATDQCVMCGMCLPHCPTYQVSQNEAESPRGRIALIKAFNENKLAPSLAMQTHLQSCTGCMKCEQVCPAKVPYQYILDNGRELYKPHLSLLSRGMQTLSILLLTTAYGQKLAAAGRALATYLPAASHFISLLKAARPELRTAMRADRLTSSIGIFSGCTGDLFDHQTLTAIERVLKRLGYKADFLDSHICCGALSQHSGSPAQARQQVKKLHAVLAQRQIKALVSLASGCGRQLKQQRPADIQHYYIMTWLKDFSNIDTLVLRPFNKRVLVHAPCTYEKSELAATNHLLDLIPQITRLEFNDDFACCGAGGGQLLLPEKNNVALVNKKVQATKAVRADIIVSTNIGCSLFLKTALQKSALDIEVIHPVTLIARQLER